MVVKSAFCTTIPGLSPRRRLISRRRPAEISTTTIANFAGAAGQRSTQAAPPDPGYACREPDEQAIARVPARHIGARDRALCQQALPTKPTRIESEDTTLPKWRGRAA